MLESMDFLVESGKAIHPDNPIMKHMEKLNHRFDNLRQVRFIEVPKSVRHGIIPGIIPTHQSVLGSNAKRAE